MHITTGIITELSLKEMDVIENALPLVINEYKRRIKEDKKFIKKNPGSDLKYIELHEDRIKTAQNILNEVRTYLVMEEEHRTYGKK